MPRIERPARTFSGPVFLCRKATYVNSFPSPLSAYFHAISVSIGGFASVTGHGHGVDRMQKRDEDSSYMIAPRFTSRARGRRRFPVFLLVCLLAGISPGALSATINVDTLDDVVDGGDSLCSLREALDNANDDALTHADCEAGTGADTIQLAQTQAIYDALLNDDLVLSGNQLIVNDAGGTAGESLTIDGRVADPSSSDDQPPERTLTIDGNGSSESNASACVTEDSRVGRIFSIQTETILTDLTLTNACVEGDGGIILNASALTLTDVDLSNGSALETTDTDGRGGAIFNDAGATLTINEGGQISSSLATRHGGGIANISSTVLDPCPVDIQATCTIALDSAAFSNNQAGLTDTAESVFLPGYGGSLHNAGGIVAGRFVSLTNSLAIVSGGGIWNSSTGTVDLLGSTIQSNQARALFAVGSEPDTVRGGGAIFNDGGTLSAEFATISGNSVTHADFALLLSPSVHGGAIASVGGDIDLNTVAMTQNQAGKPETRDNNNEVVEQEIPGFGGALYIGAGNLTVTDSTLISNAAQTDGGAIWHGGDSLNIQYGMLQNNQARGSDDEGTTATGGGGLYNDGPTTILGGRFYGNVANGTNGSGGAIINTVGGTLDITAAEIGRSSATFGAGLDNAGTLTMAEVFLGAPQIESRNVASKNGGGLHNRSGGSASIEKSALAFNDANNGGGIWNAGTLDIVNSTFSSNHKLNNGRGAGLFHSAGNATLRFTTLVSGGLHAADGTDVTAESSIISGASSGSVDADSFSLINASSPGLEGLQLYGGVTPTRPLKADSPAIDSGNTGDCEATDQREATRPFGGDCDNGSFERTNDPVLQVSPNGPEQVFATLGEDLVVLAFSLTNDGGGSVTARGFNTRPIFNGGIEAFRRLVLNDPDEVELQFDIVLDDGAGDNAGNGLLDEDETTVVGTGDASGREFQFDGGAGRALAAGVSENFLVVARLPDGSTETASLSAPTPILAGGLLIGLLGLIRLRGVRRRVQWSFLVLLLTVGLTACSESTGIDELEPPPPPVPDPSLQGQLRFKLYQLESTAAGEIIIGEGLPVYGPAISVP